ncbi:MAG: NAD(P)/FAD-dependent oxidoreductase [Lachnospiraceae bacterium]|nr:NAD(P)/FAD-dependent oxidoreductase [Lachnospiraceae bacterium]
MKDEKKKIVIIGAGIAGLSAGIYGLLAGYEVSIYEKNQVAGGECMGWNRRGYHIDNCIHWLTGTKKGTELRKVWETVGALSPDQEFAGTEVFYTSCVGNQRATLWNDLERTEKELLELSPEDEAEIRKFITHVRYAQSCEVPSSKPMDMMGIRDYIEMGRSMADMPKVMKEYGKIDLEDLAEKFKHPVLKKLVSGYMPKEYTAYSFIVSYATMASGNGEIPAGGSLAMVNRMVKRFRELGGTLFCGTSVNRILIQGKKTYGIALENGEQITADYVICAADARVLFTQLIGEKYMNKRWREVYSDTRRYPLFSGFQIAYSISKERYHENGNVLFDCEPFMIGGRSVENVCVKSFAYEKAFAPESKTVLQTNVLQYDEDYFFWESLDKEEYRRKKEELIGIITDRILTRFPELEGDIEFLDCWTPLTYHRYCNAYHGAYMSFVTKKDEKPFRVKGTVKGISNLYLASQWIMAPGGLPVAVVAGKFAVQRILKKEGRFQNGNSLPLS